MDGLQVDDFRHEKMYVSQDSNKVVAPQGFPLNTNVPQSTLPYQSPVYQQSAVYQTREQLPSRPQLPWGLSLLVYTLLVIVVTSAILGASLGGAIGTVASSKKPDPTATVTATVTLAAATTSMTTTVSSATSTSSSSSGVVSNYTPLLPSQVNTTALDCTDQAIVSSSTAQQFQLNCNINYAGNDLVNFVAYTLDTCIEACSNMNKLLGQNQCHGFLFNANLANQNANNGGNCWLKSLMSDPTPDGLTPSVGAVLLDP